MQSVCVRVRLSCGFLFISFQNVIFFFCASCRGGMQTAMSVDTSQRRTLRFLQNMRSCSLCPGEIGCGVLVTAAAWVEVARVAFPRVVVARTLREALAARLCTPLRIATRKADQVMLGRKQNCVCFGERGLLWCICALSLFSPWFVFTR